MADRQFDIVLYGASGFTGKLVAAYLIEAHPAVTWAIAGRNQQKLDALRRELNRPELPIVIADSADPGSLASMAANTKTLISTVGPYAKFGAPVLEACAHEGTHYCDLTGEAQWMAEVYLIAVLDYLAGGYRITTKGTLKKVRECLLHYSLAQTTFHGQMTVKWRRPRPLDGWKWNQAAGAGAQDPKSEAEGSAGRDAETTCETFDTNSGLWRRSHTLKYPRYGFMMWRTPTGQILLMGGQGKIET